MKLIKTTLCILGCLLLTSNIVLAQSGKKAEKEAKKLVRKSANEARKALKEEEFIKAIQFSIKALNGDGELKKKKRIKALEVFGTSYNTLHQTALQEIETLSKTHETYEDEQTIIGRTTIVKDYEDLITSIKLVRDLSGSLLNEASIKKSTFVDYTSLLDEAKESREVAVNKFVDEQYVLGQGNIEKGTKGDYRKAYYNFDKIVFYKPNYKDADSLKAMSQDSATYRVAISHFANKTEREYNRFSYVLAQRVNEGLWDKRSNKEIMKFIKIIPDYREEYPITLNVNTMETEAKKKKGKIDIVVYGVISEINHKVADATRTSSEVSKEIVVGEKTIKKDDGTTEKIKQKQTVSGTMYYYSQEQYAGTKASLYTYSVEEEKHIGGKWEKVIYGEAKHKISWERYTGDKRVLSEQTKTKVEQERPRFLSYSTMTDRAINDMAYNMVSSLIRIFEEL